MRSLSAYEAKYHMSSADFFFQYKEGKLDDSKDFVEWAGDYQHWMDLKREVRAKVRGYKVEAEKYEEQVLTDKI